MKMQRKRLLNTSKVTVEMTYIDPVSVGLSASKDTITKFYPIRCLFGICRQLVNINNWKNTKFRYICRQWKHFVLNIFCDLKDPVAMGPKLWLHAWKYGEINGKFKFKTDLQNGHNWTMI
nr:ALI_HP1_G0023520.mRNA.1.CDS.1 [Saccharomyces cerevisiae]